MLKITIPGIESWDSKNQEFIYSDAVELELEHSLVSLSKWEADWNKPFLSDEQKTTEQTIGYFRNMTLTPNVPPEIYHRLSDDNVNAVNDYIGAKMTATWFNETGNQKKPTRKEVVTSEIIYNWMIDLEIPFECKHWHLNQLITMIKVRNEKNSKNSPNQKNKMSPRELAARNRELNAKRKAQMGTSG